MRRTQWAGFLLALTAALILIGRDALNRHERLQLAIVGDSYYSEALKSSDDSDRKLLLNQALERYLHLMRMENPSSALNEVIGDIAQQLGELPWSALFYTRAYRQDSGNEALRHKVETIFSRLGQPLPVGSTWFASKRALVLIPEAIENEKGMFPLLPGATVEVLGVYPDIGGLKVQTLEGNEGYIGIGSAGLF